MEGGLQIWCIINDLVRYFLKCCPNESVFESYASMTLGTSIQQVCTPIG